jgi:HK97 family phage major capsid protein
MKYYFRRYFDTGAPGGSGGASEKETLLNEIRTTVSNELNTRGFTKKEEVEAAVNAKLEGMDIEALRAYKADKEQLNLTIRNMAGEMEKLKNRSMGAAEKVDPINEFLEKNRKQIEQRFANKSSREALEFNVRAAAVMTTSNTIDETTFSIPVMVESMSMDAFVPKRQGVQFISDIADRRVVGEVTKYKTWLEEGSEQGAFAIVAEGGLKPLVSTGLVRNFATAKKVAGKYVVTEEFSKFYNEAYNIIRTLINDKLQRDYAALLVTDLNAQAATYSATTMNGTIDGANDYDAVAAVAAQIMALNFVPDVLIVNPADLWRIRLYKDTTGRYLFPVQDSATGGIQMFGFNVVVSTYQTVGQFTLGESKLFKIEEEPITVRMGYGITVTGASPVTAVEGDFDTNRFRIIVETYFLDWIATPNIGSFVKASFATVKAALETP